MKRFRIKKEAVKFLPEKFSEAIHTSKNWEILGIRKEALEEVEGIFISYGDKPHSSSSKTMARWDSENGGSFNFTINYPGITHKQYNTLAGGENIRELMDRMQKTIDEYQDYLETTIKQN